MALLLAGQGPFLHLHNADGRKISTTRIFEVQPVLGVRVAQQLKESKSGSFHFIVWGGPLLRLGHYAQEQSLVDLIDGNCDIHLEGQQNCNDWILDAAFCDSGFLVLTAHNILLEWRLIDAESCTKRGRGLSVHSPTSFLYSGCISVTSPNSMVIASGTVFGEILVWTCDKESEHADRVAMLRHVFRGHTGSVFGISISQTYDTAGTRGRLLASCSDDRTVRIWNITDSGRKDKKASRVIEASNTGFGHENEVDETHIASAWGHESRIWDVDFVQARSGGTLGFCLLSRGEDGACQFWTVELRDDPPAGTSTAAILEPGPYDRHHIGKNAWSMCQLSDDQGLLVFTGGADGQIILRRFDNLLASRLSTFTLTAHLNDITGSSAALKHYHLLSHSECLATTGQGGLIRLHIKGGQLRWLPIQAALQGGGLVLCHIEACALTLVAPQTGGVFVLLRDQQSLAPVSCELAAGILWMRVAGEHSGPSSSTPCILAVLADKAPVILWLHVAESSIRMSKTSLSLPDTFSITACHYDQSTKALLLGSRAGAVAVYSNVTPETTVSTDPYCLRHIHGTDSVSSVSVLQQAGESADTHFEKTHVLTTGRDGNYAIHRLEWLGPAGIIQPELSLVHLSSPPFGPHIEGAEITAMEGATSNDEQDLILYGFKSTSFVVWNETQLSEIFSVECGGSHRSWSFKGDFNSSSHNGAHSFVWTKAGKFNWHQKYSSSHTVIEQGGHGREIKAVARSPVPHNTTGRQDDGVTVATGAEDTNIQIFVVAPRTASTTSQSLGHAQSSTQTAFKRVAILKQHTTGLQHLQYSPSGQYLFSSAGCEEFYVWKISLGVPCVGIGVVLWDVMPTEKEDSDARIMSFDLFSADPQDDTDSESHTIVMAYSNGKTKIVRYTCSAIRSRGTFEKLRELEYGSFCLMQTLFLSSPSRLSAGASQKLRGVLSGGTNGYLNLGVVGCDLEPGVLARKTQLHLRMEAHKVHQSSVLAVDIVCLSPTTHLIASGGDDNALGLTLLTSSLSGSGEECDTFEHPHRNFQTIFIPSAHAAAVTALKIRNVTHGVTCTSAMVITVSNDQRVKVWRIDIDLSSVAADTAAEVRQDRLFEAVRVKLVESAWTSVADASGLEVISEGTSCVAGQDYWQTGGEVDILIVGVGMEQLSLKWRSDP